MCKDFDFKGAAQCVSRWAENRKVHSDVVVKMQTVGLLILIFLLPFYGGFTWYPFFFPLFLRGFASFVG